MSVRQSAAGAAVVLVGDRNYLLPTLSTALSAEHFTRASGAPVYVFVVDADEAWLSDFARSVAGTRIRLRPAAIPELATASRFHRDRYLPPIALARLWIDRLLDPEIDRFLYLDGDTMVDGDLDPLLCHRPPQNALMVVPDFLRIFIGELGLRKSRDLAYLRGIGCGADEYFNSGVIYCSRQAWRQIAPDAIAFLKAHPELCRASDQSALNRAAYGATILLPLKYNYQSEHMMVLDPRKEGIRPKIWHFTGGPKPWHSADWPWDDSFNRFYVAAERLLRGLGVAAPVPPEAQTASGLAHRRRTRLRLTWFYPWRKLSRRRKIRKLLANSPRAQRTPPVAAV
jgi:lipopolysaccharide biosynthesis glycosyltransferase